MADTTLNALEAAPTTAPAPPVARKVPKVETVHGERRQDDYFWLREKTNPEVAAYLEAENAYADGVMAPTAAFQESLYAEMLARIQETDVNVPYRQGEYFYYSRTEQGKQYPIFCRKRADTSPNAERGGARSAAPGEEHITLDLNLLAEGHTFMALGAYAVSDDGTLLAYSTDATGFRQYDLFIKDLRTGVTGPALAAKTGSVAW
ncbi:MAG TPA: oligopeptidase B, partial [Vicinamibacteria bacterium]|nr:oligopeptidase B [Vicinamibacteria bacterium]